MLPLLTKKKGPCAANLLRFHHKGVGGKGEKRGSKRKSEPLVAEASGLKKKKRGGLGNASEATLSSSSKRERRELEKG